MANFNYRPDQREFYGLEKMWSDGEEIDLSEYDFVVDCIDNVTAKLELIEQYSLAGLSLYSFESSLSQGHGFLQQLYSAEKLL